jgi:hypothetical protein
MKKLITILCIVLVGTNFVNSQVILSNDTIACGSFNDTLYALSSETNGITADDGHGPAVPIGFAFSFYGVPYTQLVISGNGYLTFDISQANQYSPWAINFPIPNPGNLPQNAIMAPWHDLNPGLGGDITYGTVGIAPNRKFIVTWCNVPMFSCNTLTPTSQVVLYEGSNKIEIHIEDKQLCVGWNGGSAIHGLVDATSANFNIVNDPILPLNPPRNFPLPWIATNESWEFIPNTPASYTINQIVPFVPVVAGIANWYSDPLLLNFLASGATLPVNLTTTGVYTYYVQVIGDCFPLAVVDSVKIIFNSSCFSINCDTELPSCFGDDGAITVNPDTTLAIWDIELFDYAGTSLQFNSALTSSSFSYYNLEPDTFVVRVTTPNGIAQDTIILQHEPNLLTYQSQIIEPYCLGDY